MTFDSLSCASLAVRSLGDATKTYEEKLGLVPMGPVRDSELGFSLRWQSIGNGEIAFIDLIEPTDPKSPIARFLERNGEGVYLVQFKTPDVNAAARELNRRGARVIGAEKVDEAPLKMCWVHPASTHGMLVELIGYEA